MSSSINNDHERRYMPTEWPKRGNSEVVLKQFVKICEDAADKARKSTKCSLDVPYGDTKLAKFDIYGQDLPQDAPTLIFIHGGYWRELDKKHGATLVPSAIPKGIKVASIGYDLCPNVTISQIVSQIRTAVEKVIKSASDGGCRKVWIVGHSAGAHLAASVLYNKSWMDRVTAKYPSTLKGLVLISGIYNLRPLLTTSVNEDLKFTEEDIVTYSFGSTDIEPIQGIRAIVVVGESDSPQFVEESRMYAQKLITILDNVDFRLLRDNIDHFDIVERLIDPEFVLTKIILDAVLSD